MPLCPTTSFRTLSGTTTFVTRLNSLLLSYVKEFVKPSIVVKNFSMFISLWESTEAIKIWWWVPPSFAISVPAISLASSAWLARSGEMKEKLSASVWIQGESRDFYGPIYLFKGMIRTQRTQCHVLILVDDPVAVEKLLVRSQDLNWVGSVFRLDIEGSFWHNLFDWARRNT